MSDKRRFDNAGDAAHELYESYNVWSKNLASYSLQVSFSIIAANWAVHGNRSVLLSNVFAKLSIGTIIGFLGLNLFAVGWMTALYRTRCDYADEDKDRWTNEFKQTANISSPWPYTHRIQNIGHFLERFRIWMPVISGIMFLFSLFIA